MFTNTNQAAPAATPTVFTNFVRNIDPRQCSEVLDELFFEWVGSEGSDDTGSEYRASVVHIYRQMKDLLLGIEKSQEVNHD